jgi:hypothetical protein
MGSIPQWFQGMGVEGTRTHPTPQIGISTAGITNAPIALEEYEIVITMGIADG